MSVAQTDFALATITVAPYPPLSGTTLRIPTTAIFPAVPFDAAIWPYGVTPSRSSVELVRVTAVNDQTGQLTMLRGRNGTHPLAIIAGFQISSIVEELWLASDGIGFVNPMSRIGDTMYGGSGGDPASLSGNVTARRKWLAQRGTGTVSTTPIWANSPWFNVDDFGAMGDGLADDTVAINAAAAALVSAGGGALFFPGKNYLTSGITPVTTVPCALFGNGLGVSTVTNTHLTNPTLSVTGQHVQISGLKFTCTQNRPNGNPLFNVDGVSADPLVYVSNCQIRSHADCFRLYRCVSNFSQVTIKCLKQGGYAIWSSRAGFTAVNSLFFTVGTTSPAMWLQGEATSVSIANSLIAGAGPRFSHVPTSITSTAVNFTVNFSANHSFAIGDWINISGVTPAAYRGYWRIAVKTATSVTVTSAINPGNATIAIAVTALVANQRYAIASLGTSSFTGVGAAFNSVGIAFKATGAGVGTGIASGTVYSPTCSLLIDNEQGSINESQITGSQIGASGYPQDPLSVGIYVDGRRGNGSIEGWQVSDCYIDLGRLGILLAGKGTGGGATTKRWQIESTFFKGNAGEGNSTMVGQVWIEQCPSVSLHSLKSSDANKDPNCIALYVYSDGAAPFCDGLIVNGCELGICDNWSGVSVDNVAKYAAKFEGTINLLTFSSNVCWGSTAPVLNTTSITSATIVKSLNNTFLTGVVWPTTTVYVPFFSDDGGIPIGGIVPFAGAFADIPTNWHLCDGTGGTIDLTDRFILGTNIEAEVGDMGGTAQHKHAAGTLAADSASAGTPSGTVSVNSSTANDTAVTGAGARVTAITGSSFAGNAMAGHTHTISGKTADAEDGAGSTTDVLPPWYKLAFIQRVS